MNELVTRSQSEQLKPLQEISKTSATGQRPAVPSLRVAPTTVGKSNRIWNHLSILWNRFRKRRLESAKEVARAEREFLEESEALQRTRARYQDLGIDIEAEKQLRQDQYLAAKLDRELALEEKRLKLEQLRRVRTGLEEKAWESGDEQYQEQLQAAMRRADFETALRIIQAKKIFKLSTDLARERDRLIEEIINGDAESLTAEQELQVNNIKSFFQRMIDEIESGTRVP
jgi:hypothetical protein